MESKEFYNKRLRGTLTVAVCFISLFVISSCENPKEAAVKQKVTKQQTARVKKEVPKNQLQKAPLPAPPEPPKWVPEEETPRSPEQEALLKDLQASNYCKVANSPVDYIKEQRAYPNMVPQYKISEEKIIELLKKYIILDRAGEVAKPLQIYMNGQWQESSYYGLTVHYKKLWQEVCNKGELNLPELWHTADLLERFTHSLDFELYQLNLDFKMTASDQLFYNVPNFLPAISSQPRPYKFNLDHTAFHKLAAISTKKSDHEFFALKKFFEPGDQKTQAFATCTNISLKNIMVARQFDRLLSKGMHPVYKENLVRNKVRIAEYYGRHFGSHKLNKKDDNYRGRQVCYCPSVIKNPKEQFLKFRKFYLKEPIPWLEASITRSVKKTMKADIKTIFYIPFKVLKFSDINRPCINEVTPSLRHGILSMSETP